MPNDKEQRRVRSRKPARTPEGRENQLISAAMDLAEQQIRDGTASSQVITHYLRLGTEKYKLEQKKLEADTKLSLAKVEAAETNKVLEEKYDRAIAAMRTYSGLGEQTYELDEDL